MTNILMPLVVIALVMAFGILGLVVVDTIIAMQEAEAQSTTGQCAKIVSQFRNGSTRFCPHG